MAIIVAEKCQAEGFKVKKTIDYRPGDPFSLVVCYYLFVTCQLNMLFLGPDHRTLCACGKAQFYFKKCIH